MKCIIPGRFVKLFGRSIHCLSRIGDELFFEALQDGLALRTVNSSRSAYASFIFSTLFFHEYEQGCEEIEGSNPSELLKCKITMKSCLAIFKSLSTIDKTVEQCKIDFQPDKCRLIFILYCKHGITKTHNLTFQECESLKAVYSKELCPNLMIAQSKVLLDTVMNFPNSCEEITISVSPESVKVTNYVDAEPDPSKVVHTEMTLVPEEFDNFQIGVDTQVTFCLKELRAILAFSEFVNQPLSLHFEHSGKPIVFSLDGDNIYEGNFVMATLSDNIEASTQHAENTNNTSSHKKTAKEIYLSQKNKQRNSNTSIIKNSINNSTVSVSNHRKIKPKSPEQTVPDEHSNIVSQLSKRARIGSITEQQDDDFFTDSFPKEILEDPIQNNNKTSPLKRLNSSILRSSALPAIPNNSIDLTEIDDDEVLLSTPPVSKNFKSSMFFGSDEKKSDTKQKEQVILLAADTDDEDEDD